MDSNEKNLKLAQSAQVINDATDLLQKVDGLQFIVAKLDANSNTKVHIVDRNRNIVFQK